MLTFLEAVKVGWTDEAREAAAQARQQGGTQQQSTSRTLTDQHRQATADYGRRNALPISHPEAGKFGSSAFVLPNGGKLITSVSPRSSNSRGAARGGHLATTYHYVGPGEKYSVSMSRGKVETLLQTHGFGKLDPQDIRTDVAPETHDGVVIPEPVLRTEEALTGDPLVDAVMRGPTTSRNINFPVIDRSYDVPYGAGGSVPLVNPVTFIDRHMPTTLTVNGVTFDPADPWVVHENLEQRVMELLIQAGFEPETAYRIGHFEFAEVAEDAWYRFHGIDPAAAEAAERPYLNTFEDEDPENPPPQLYLKPYPHDNLLMAQYAPHTELKPTPEEIARARAILEPIYLGDNIGQRKPGDAKITVTDLELRDDMATKEQITAYLMKHAPEIAALVEKDATVSDVHAPSSLGSQRRRRKGRSNWKRAQSFKDAISTAYFQGDETTKRFELEIAKVDNENQQVFGWASVCSVNGDEIIDKQGDIIPVAEIEKAAYEFVQFSRDLGDMHLRMGTGRMIESAVFTDEKAKCGITAKDESGNTICGWWVGFHVVDPEAWKSFKAGERPELSIGGKATWEDA